MGIKTSAKFDGGFIEVCLRVENGIITECRIFGDFMSTADIDVLESSLAGTVFSPEEIKKAVLPLPLKDILGDITADELVECIFN